MLTPASTVWVLDDENTFFFIADEDLDIYPYGFGLEPVSLKSHEETPEEVATAVQELHELVSEPEVPVTVVENGTVPEGQQDQQGSPEGQQHQQDSPDVQKATKGPVNPIAVFLLILAIALVALLVFTIVARLSPGIFDSILYTPEELRIINY